MDVPIKRVDDLVWEVPVEYNRYMRVPARIYADEALLSMMKREKKYLNIVFKIVMLKRSKRMQN